MFRFGQPRPRFIISNLVVPLDRDCDFRWALTTFGIKVISLARPNGHSSRYSLAVPDWRSLSNFIACHLGPRVLDRDADAFLEAHVREVTPATQSP